MLQYNLARFLQLPAGTLYIKQTECDGADAKDSVVRIKCVSQPNEIVSRPLFGLVTVDPVTGNSTGFDFESVYCDEAPDNEVLYDVLEPEDLLKLGIAFDAVIASEQPVQTAFSHRPKIREHCQFWRNDALKAAAGIARQYGAHDAARDIEFLVKP